MFRSRYLHLVECSALLLPLASGCHLFCRDRPVTILATDAETGKPLPEADVKIAYFHTNAPFEPADADAKTGDDGIAHLNATPADPVGVAIHVGAAGYLSEEKFLSARAIEAIAPVPLLFPGKTDSPPTLTLALYAGPRPTVELVVHNGYRGVINAEIHVQDNAPCPPGQRCFSSTVPSSGEVRITGPALLRRIESQDFTARYADGTPLPRTVKDAEVGLWFLRESGEDHYTFLVGTKSDYDQRKPAARTISSDGSADKSSRGGRGGGGRKGGGRRGGGGQSSF